MKDALRKILVAAAVATPLFGWAPAGQAANEAPDLFNPQPAAAPMAPEVAAQAEPVMPDDAALAKRITGYFSVVFPTKYISRGVIPNRNARIIAPPSAEIAPPASARNTRSH